METLFTKDIVGGDEDDDLLNFSLEVDEIEDFTKSTNLYKGSSSFCSSNGSGGGSGGGGDSLLADEEEDLEWISNKDAFPAIEFGILDEKPDIGVLGQHSPVSVLESVVVSGNGDVRSGTTDNRTGRGTLRVPTGFPNDIRKKRVGRKPRIGFEQYKHLFLAGHQVNLVDVQNYRQETPNRRVKVARNRASTVDRRCSHCGSDKTPQWRTGPMGNKTLCNACGVRYKSGRLVPEYRPANSPTFSTVLHSNSHRKIMEMRRVKQEGTGQQMRKEKF